MRIRQIEDLPVVASMLSQSEQQKIVGGVNVTRYAFIVRLFHSLLSTDFDRRFLGDPCPFTNQRSTSSQKTRPWEAVLTMIIH